MSPDQKRYYELLILQLKAAFSDDAAIKQSYMDALYRYLERILGIPADGGTTSSILESFFRILFQQIVLENDQITFDVFPFENISELIEALIKYATDGPTTGGSSDEKQIEMLLQALLDQLFIGSGMVQIYLFTTVGANGEDLFTYWQNLLGVDVSEILRTQGMAGLLILLQDAGYLSYNPSSPPPFGPIEFNTDDHNPVMINQLSGYIYLWYLLTGLGSLFNNEDPF
jgi:hypothetical protein